MRRAHASASSSSTTGITLRIRHKGGMWRVKGVNPQSMTAGQLKERINKEYKVPVEDQTLRKEYQGEPLPDQKSLKQAGIAQNGEIVFCDFEEEAPVLETDPKAARTIGKDGNITRASHHELNKNKQFRPGVPPMKDLQKHWNWMEFMDLQKSLTFEVKRQEEAICSKATLDTEACGNLTTYLQNVAFQQCRMGYLYGRFADDNSAKVAAIYEPPQEVSPEDCITLDDPQESSVRLVQDLLGLQRVGWVFTHPPGREEGFRFTGKELLRAAELQLQGGEESPFVTVKVTATEDGHSEFDAFQISKQGLEMCQNGVLDIHPSDAKKVAPDPKFSIIVEKSEVKEVDTDFFLTVVPIAQYNSGLSSSFPKASREGREITKDDFANFLRKQKADGKNIVQALADFNCLVFMASQEYLSSVVPSVCEAILNSESDLPEGYKLLITSFADIDWQ